MTSKSKTCLSVLLASIFVIFRVWNRRANNAKRLLNITPVVLRVNFVLKGVLVNISKLTHLPSNALIAEMTLPLNRDAKRESFVVKNVLLNPILWLRSQKNVLIVEMCLPPKQAVRKGLTVAKSVLIKGDLNMALSQSLGTVITVADNLV